MRICWILVIVLISCERPFVETTEPELLVVEPDLSVVQTSAVIVLRVQSAHFRALRDVSVNGVPMDPASSGPNDWQTSVGLSIGLNTFYLVATDLEGVSRRDTAYAVYLPHRISLNAPALPEGRGGHSLVRLRDGSLMVTGGARQRQNLAQGESFLLSSNSGVFSQIPERLRSPRTGHTASVLPDGRVLIVGGSRIDSPTNVNDLIETVEIFDPSAADRSFTELPVRGQPIRRIDHTTIVRQADGEWLIDLVGGIGDTRYGSNPFFGIRRDLRTFRVDSDGLTALNTVASAPFIQEPVSNHTATQTPSGSYVILGSRFANGLIVNGNMRIHYSKGSELYLSSLPGLLTPRTAHATASVLNGVFAVFGGQLESSDPITTMEIFHEQTSTFFTMAPSQSMLSRSDHTAISDGLRSALLVGGFDRNGTALKRSEYFVVSFN